jgi:prepilin-type N-terminal cleavage/methylation domain-containing protein
MSKDPPDAMAARRGMTLIEVMLAVAILSIAGISLITAMGQGVTLVHSARLYNVAHQLLARVDLEHPLFDEDVEVGVEQGCFTDPGLGAFVWRRTIEIVGEEEDRLFQISTRVSWTRRGQEGYEEVVSYRYAPEVEE